MTACLMPASKFLWIIDFVKQTLYCFFQDHKGSWQR